MPGQGTGQQALQDIAKRHGRNELATSITTRREQAEPRSAGRIKTMRCTSLQARAHTQAERCQGGDGRQGWGTGGGAGQVSRGLGGRGGGQG